MHEKLVELEKQFNRSPLTQVFTPLLDAHQVELWIKRDDLIHPIISGNKWRKLKYILNHALMLDSHTIVSMGGVFSNHLHALAFAGKQLKLKTKAFVRGERPKKLNPTLEDILSWGMVLTFISRSEYRALRHYKAHDALESHQDGEYWLPEGGATVLALQGVAEILAEINPMNNVVCVPCGTATTLAGLVRVAPSQTQLLGFSALKGADFLVEDVKQLLELCEKSTNQQNWSIQLDYHFGGFAKKNDTLQRFVTNFSAQHHIQIEPVYTGKMFYGLFDLLQQGYFKAGQKIIAIHTGGLQGNRQ